MESEWEKEIRELLDALTRESLGDLLKEIADAPIPFIDYEPSPKPRKTRRKKKALKSPLMTSDFESIRER